MGESEERGCSAQLMDIGSGGRDQSLRGAVVLEGRGGHGSTLTGEQHGGGRSGQKSEDHQASGHAGLGFQVVAGLLPVRPSTAYDAAPVGGADCD